MYFLMICLECFQNCYDLTEFEVFNPILKLWAVVQIEASGIVYVGIFVHLQQISDISA